LTTKAIKPPAGKQNIKPLFRRRNKPAALIIALFL
jgi:hypothetical protein